MNKLRRIFETTPEISFISPQTEFSLYWNSFLESELGIIYRSIPWAELVKVLKLKETIKCRKCWPRKPRKPWKQTVRRTRSLLYLLNKLIRELDKIEDQHRSLRFPEKYWDKRRLIRKVLSQQQEIFETGGSVPERIMSISKSYIRPIVRGKEVKKVEFGAEVNMIQVDGITFIEHLSFNAFNEGNRLIDSIWCSRSLFGKVTYISADDIYATNAKRQWCIARNITNNFKRKGRAGKYEDQRMTMAAELRKERATRMEGRFGTEKQHYSLDKIKARIRKNEILWIFFGVHTANAVRIAKRQAQEEPSISAA
ncbi:MAG: hypothetical protein ACLFQA_07770 [Bacteroidales bacterium]